MKFKKDPDLDRLDKILNFDLSGKTPTTSYLNPAGVGQAWIIIAILATPVVLWTLAKKRKLGWLISFLIFVFSPWYVSVIFLEKDHMESFFPPYQFYYYISISFYSSKPTRIGKSQYLRIRAIWTS
jgi:hypothetical protein